MDPMFLSGVFWSVGFSVENITGKSLIPFSRASLRICLANGHAKVFESFAIFASVGSVLRAAPIDDINGVFVRSHHL